MASWFSNWYEGGQSEQERGNVTSSQEPRANSIPPLAVSPSANGRPAAPMPATRPRGDLENGTAAGAPAFSYRSIIDSMGHQRHDEAAFGKHSGMTAEFQRHQAQMKLMMQAALDKIDLRLSNVEQLWAKYGKMITESPKALVSPQTPDTSLVARDNEGSLRALEGSYMAEKAALQEKVDGTNMQIGVLQAQISKVKSDVDNLKKAAADYVTVPRYELDLKTIEIDRDLVMIKGGYLAVSISQSSPADKQKILDSLDKKQEELRADRPASGMAVTSLKFVGGPGSPRSIENGEDLQDTPDEFVIQVDRSKGEKLGVSVESPDGKYLRITSIDGGLLRSWNERNTEFAVRPGYFITAVNDQHGSNKILETQLRKDGYLRIRIHRNLGTNVLSLPTTSTT